MTIMQFLGSYLVVPLTWGVDWAWGLPLIVLTVVIHVLGLGLIRQKGLGAFERIVRDRHHVMSFAVILGGTTLLVTVLHGIEASMWALTYLVLNAFSERKEAMLYSLNAMTSYGHLNQSLPPHWHLMGALEALNGWLLFGLTTAFLFAVIEQSGMMGTRRGHDRP